MKNLLSYSGWVALVLGFSALFIYIIIPDKTLIVFSVAGAALASALAFVFSDWNQVRKILTGRSAVHGTNSLILTVAFLGILIFTNLLASRHNKRIDFTEGGLFTLSQQSEKVVSNLKNKVKITAFFQAEAPEKKQFENLVDGYLALTDQIELEYVDPDKDPRTTERYGVRTYGTIALESGKNETQVTAPDEGKLTNGIIKVIQEAQKKIYFLEGHGEKAIDQGDKDSYSTAKEVLEKDNFKVEKLSLLDKGKIPEDADVLIIPGPAKPLLQEETKLIHDYLEQGGSTLLLIDPNTRLRLDAFLAKWGVKLQDDFIINPTPTIFGDVVNAPPIISKFADHEITKDFRLKVVLPNTRSIYTKIVDGVQTIELMKTEPQVWAESRYMEKNIKFDQGEDLAGPVPVAVVSTMDLKPDSKDKLVEGKPEADGEASEKLSKQSRLVVIGDSDFANNSYFYTSGNGDFFLNIASWLAKEENLISIRPKQAKFAPVTLSPVQASLIQVSCIIGIPMFVFAVGFRIWWRRRAL